MRFNRREKMEGMGLLGVREFNKRRFNSPSKPLSPHIHPDAMEIVFLYRGEQTYCVDNKEYHLRGMDLFLTYPNELHSTGVNPEEKSNLYYMIVDTVHNQECFLGINDPHIAYLPQTLNALPVRKYRGNKTIFNLWETIYDVCDSDHPIRETIIRMHMLELLLEIIGCANETQATITPDIKRTANYIREHISEYMTIESLARISELSTSRFKAKFRHQMGMPPGEYIQRERISRAKLMLREGKSVTYIAHELNYASSQHLSNYFKKFVGISPSEYRKKHSINK
jgi:AraC-like DNA-binding protein